MPADYFITICTSKKKEFFGECSAGKMVLSEVGVQALKFWQAIPEHFPFVKLGVEVVIPNHVHGIIRIREGIDSWETESAYKRGTQEVAIRGNNAQFGPQSKNLASIIRGFKGGLTSWCIANDIEFKWQPRYFDRIVRSKGELMAYSKYIKNNPKNWNVDEFKSPK